VPDGLSHAVYGEVGARCAGDLTASRRWRKLLAAIPRIDDLADDHSPKEAADHSDREAGDRLLCIRGLTPVRCHRTSIEETCALLKMQERAAAS
jgi:hypothetical protein